ncbi:MAG TPA: tetratricopeptide repeat protein, partial [Luteolibacter sp.]|nr:tetratricopeptide repeat protein [Luteolibacter sp.]
LNEAGRIKQLIEQNMGHAKNLREATEKVETLNVDNNNTKDTLTESLRDLAMAKFEINKLKEAKRDQDGQLEKLTTRLKGEEAALARGEVSADPAEVEMLRDIIKRQLRAQEWRRQSRDTLVDEAKKLGLKDENLAKAMELFTGEDLQLTQEEQRLIAERKVDGEFVSPFARDPAAVGRATDSLNQEVETYNRAATKAYTSERYGPAKELFQMTVEMNPGDTGALCKLGLVHMKLHDSMSASDTFRRAVELDGNNAYAHRMLGLSQLELGDMSGAEQSVARSVELAPDDAKSQILLGAILYSSDKTREAETHWKAAIEADPMLSEPHINLAVLCAKAKRKNDARAHYQAALERGAVPDPRIEKFLDSRP